MATGRHRHRKRRKKIDGHVQCDQIGIFLKVLDDNIFYKSNLIEW